MNKPINIIELCLLFQVDVSKLPNLMQAGPLPEVEKKLKEFKAIFKQAYRKAALECHPDKGASEKQIARFKKMTGIYKDLQKIKVQKVPIRRPARTVIIRTGGFGGYYSSTTSSTTGSGGATWHWSSSRGGSGTDEN